MWLQFSLYGLCTPKAGHVYKYWLCLNMTELVLQLFSLKLQQACCAAPSKHCRVTQGLQATCQALPDTTLQLMALADRGQCCSKEVVGCCCIAVHHCLTGQLSQLGAGLITGAAPTLLWQRKGNCSMLLQELAQVLHVDPVSCMHGWRCLSDDK